MRHRFGVPFCCDGEDFRERLILCALTTLQIYESFQQEFEVGFERKFILMFDYDAILQSLKRVATDLKQGVLFPRGIPGLCDSRILTLVFALGFLRRR